MTSKSLAHLDSNLPYLPEGYSQRAATTEDAEAIARVINASILARHDDEVVTAEFLLRDWQEPNWELSASSQVALNPHGEIIGFVSVWDVYNPAHANIGVDVRPGEHWPNVMRVLTAWGEQRALQALERCEPEERVAPFTYYHADSAEQTLFESLGYKAIRYSFHMGITLQDAPTVIPLPTGFTLKTFDYPAELERLVVAQDEMWEDHYGYIKHPLDELVRDWTQFIANDPKFDPTMWYIATDDATGEIAGLVLCELEAATKPTEGYISIVGVRRAYRKQGLAQAMLTHALTEYWRRGQKTVGLGVDGSSLTGATRLYERVGMVITKRYVRLEKEMRPGLERMNTGH